MDDVSLLAVVLGSVAFFFLGAAWYTVLFGRAWRAGMGVPDDATGSPMALAFAGSFVCGLVLSFTLALLIGDAGVGRGVVVGAGTGVGLVGPVMAQNAIYEQRSVRFLLINLGYAVAGFAVVGVICGVLQA